ncbi:MAG TPA: hypothetical protein VFG79_06100, partial [Solirubrobacter sp.]|nr:hypothetical protein [Solirubrobacter sp.]
MTPVTTIAAWRSRLPRGETLPPENWTKRHRALTAIAWAHVPALLLFGLVVGKPLDDTLMELMPVAVFAWLAGRGQLTRNQRAAAVCFSLLTSSAVLVQLWDGQIEAHFHFFVMVTLLATYEQWFPYLLAFLYVLVHHGAMGLLASNSVYSHAAGQHHPWQWAAVHAL